MLSGGGHEISHYHLLRGSGAFHVPDGLCGCLGRHSLWLDQRGIYGRWQRCRNLRRSQRVEASETERFSRKRLFLTRAANPDTTRRAKHR